MYNKRNNKENMGGILFFTSLCDYIEKIFHSCYISKLNNFRFINMNVVIIIVLSNKMFENMNFSSSFVFLFNF